MKSLTLISNIMISIMFVYYSWPLLCDIISIFCKKKQYPAADPFRFAVLICARNEEKVIGNLLDSLARQDYPREYMTVFVVAHNCTDDTARIARERGAVVFERNCPEEALKGDALHYGVAQITKTCPGMFDALCVFDADNVAGRTFLREINAALHSGADVAQGFRNSKNYHENAVSELFGAYWYQIMLCQNLPHTAMGLPSTIGGTGFAVTMEALGGEWKTFTMLEDIEFTAQMVLRGKKCILAPFAIFYDEQPTSWKTGIRQRYRWSAGGYQVLRLYLPRMIKAVPVRGAQAVKMIPDLLINPIMLVSLTGYILLGIINGVTGGAGSVLQYLLHSLGFIWIVVLPLTLILFWRERMNPLKNLWTILLFPYFLVLSMPLSLPALFDRNPKWKPVPHSDVSTIETLEKQGDPPLF